MNPSLFPYVRHGQIGVRGMLVILLIASVAVNITLLFQSARGVPADKQSAQSLLTGNGEIKFDEFGQPQWWSAPLKIADQDFTVGMLSTLDSQTLTIGAKPGVMYAQIDVEGRVTFLEGTGGSPMPEWWDEFKQVVNAHDWQAVFHQAKEANLMAIITSAHTRVCNPGTRDTTLVVCDPILGGDSIYVYKLQPGQK